ncbi:oxidoreductase [Amycolatopsis balhimycina DSM 5908]|uniref:Probable oxidoreductase n=1 Tax=Amycolatopsis balhimycina DSM 5908 TaxID=1081091 RepID=A0A428WRP7_AMYBA|nr:SDR family NAD(P)-dependent oxidoreductase [Amycolatopsis balhimycina]RSM45775.1 oxidoreductase [Amycolatopsis balhimycina DSM 5908]
MTARQLITTPFTAAGTADDVLAGVDLAGVRVIVTGASSGIGAETARALAAAGAEVTLAVRNIAATPRSRVARLDLADQTSVRRFTQAWDGPLHILVNNAGIVTGGPAHTAEGWELQFATNHLGHFALATGLHAALARGAADRGESRIVSVSSTAHMRAGIDFADLHFERRPYDPQIAYAQSKTANSLFAVEATRRWAADGIYANTANPGGVATGLQRNFTPAQKQSLAAAEAAGVFAYKTVEQGAATSVVAAVAPQFAHTGGHYLDDAQEAYTVPDDAELADHPHGVKAWALDPATAERLWEVSAELTRG